MVKLSGMVEKPKQEDTPSKLAVIGRYILTLKIFEMLETQEAGEEIQLTDAIDCSMDHQAVYAYDLERHNPTTLETNLASLKQHRLLLNRVDLKEQVQEYLKQLMA